MGKKMITIEWTETWQCMHEFDLDEACEFLEAQGVDVPQGATIEEVFALFDEMDLEDGLADIGIDGALHSDVDRTDCKAELVPASPSLR